MSIRLKCCCGDTGFIPVKVWRDGGSDVGSKTTACNITYQARTMDATSETTGTQLGTGLTPKKHRWAGNLGKIDCPSSTGAGVEGVGYYDSEGTFVLFDANETPDTGPCS